MGRKCYNMKRQTFIQGSILLIGSAIVVKLIGAFFKIPLANVLGGNGMNYFGCSYSLFLPIYAVMINGLSPAVSKLTAERVSIGDYTTIEKIRRVSLIVFTIVGVLGSILMIVCSKIFCTYIAESPKSYLSVIALAPSVLFGCVCSVYRGYYEGLCNMLPTSLSQLVEAVSKLIFGLSLSYYTISNYDTLSRYFSDSDVYSLASASAILGISLSTGVGLLIMLLFEPFRKKSKVEAISNVERRLLVKELVSIMIPIAVGSLVTNLTTIIDLATIIRCIEDVPESTLSKSYGVYSKVEDFSGFVYGSYSGLAITIFNLVPSITNMLSKGALPNITTSWKHKDLHSVQKDFCDMIAITSMIAIPSGLGIVALSKQILLFLYPQRVDEVSVCYEALSCMGVGVVFLCLSFPIFSVLQGIDRADLPIKIMLVGVLVKLIGNILLLSNSKTILYGAGISTSICYFVIFLMSFVAFVRVTNIKVNLFKILLPISYGAILCSISAVISVNVLSNYLSSRLSLLLSIMIGGLIYVLTLYLTNFKVTDTLSFRRIKE